MGKWWSCLFVQTVKVPKREFNLQKHRHRLPRQKDGHGTTRSDGVISKNLTGQSLNHLFNPDLYCFLCLPVLNLHKAFLEVLFTEDNLGRDAD